MSHKDMRAEAHYFIATDGRGLFHTGYKKENTEVVTGQKLILFKDDKEALYNAFFKTWEETVEGVVGELNEVRWNTKFMSVDHYKQMQLIVSLATADHLRIDPIKHPGRNEWAMPIMDEVLALIPDSHYKTLILDANNNTIAQGWQLTEQEMIDGGWL